jgi:hypothetical protein
MSKEELRTEEEGGILRALGGGGAGTEEKREEWICEGTGTRRRMWIRRVGERVGIGIGQIRK